MLRDPARCVRATSLNLISFCHCSNCTLTLEEVRGPLNYGAPIGWRRRAEKATGNSDWAVQRGLSNSLVPSSRTISRSGGIKNVKLENISRLICVAFCLKSGEICAIGCMPERTPAYVFFAASPRWRRRSRPRPLALSASHLEHFPRAPLVHVYGHLVQCGCRRRQRTDGADSEMANGGRKWEERGEDCVSAFAHAVAHMDIALTSG